MTARRMEQTLRFISACHQEIAGETGAGKIGITFHGGEPLAAGYKFLQSFLSRLAATYPSHMLELDMQSNLWLLEDRTCALLREHRVSVGTSLDGPEWINDSQRGAGYFSRTMKGIERARRWGLDVGCIATFTKASRPFWREIADFFVAEQLPFSVHGSVPGLNGANSEYALTPDERADLFGKLLHYYMENRKKIAISTFDQMAKGMVEGRGHLCTFKDCLGMFLSIDPAGDIYPCQRFSGNPQYRLGNLDEAPSLEALWDSPPARRMKERERQVAEMCGECAHYPYCRGGCCYNTWAGGGDAVKDPYCAAYGKTFAFLQERLLGEIESAENIAAIARNPAGTGRGVLLKKGDLISIVRPGPHPSSVARNAKRVIAAVELARGPDAGTVAGRLVALGICRNQNTALASVEGLRESWATGNARVNNLYLHLTFACQLRCTHCYAQAEMSAKGEMRAESIEALIGEARELGFRHVVMTGGEPLLHSRKGELLATLQRVKHAAHPSIHPLILVLRTNLALPLSETELREIAGAFHEVVVSIDGDQAAHDARRGAGSYDASVSNMETYGRLAECGSGAAELSIAAVLRKEEIEGAQGWAVRQLAERLHVRRTRFRPLLPLGRAAEWEEPPQSEALGGYLDPMETIESGFLPVASCGMGQNLYVEPSGESFPCYAFHRRHAYLGNVIANGLAGVIGTERFRDLRRHTVDTNPTCRECDYRYLCGGACRAWGGESAQHDLDAPPGECGGLKQRAVNLFHAAWEYLELEGKTGE